jgi:hypothetical protein
MIPREPTTSTARSPFRRKLAEGNLAAFDAAETRHRHVSCCEAWNCHRDGRMAMVQ